MGKGRPPDTGLEKPYRPMPADFWDVYVRMGWSKEITEHYRTNWRCIRRWIDEAGGDDLRMARAKVSGGHLRPKQRSKPSRYVQGRRLTAVMPPKEPS